MKVRPDVINQWGYRIMTENRIPFKELPCWKNMCAILNCKLEYCIENEFEFWVNTDDDGYGFHMQICKDTPNDYWVMESDWGACRFTSKGLDAVKDFLNTLYANRDRLLFENGEFWII